MERFLFVPYCFPRDWKKAGRKVEMEAQERWLHAFVTVEYNTHTWIASPMWMRTSRKPIQKSTQNTQSFILEPLQEARKILIFIPFLPSTRSVFRCGYDKDTWVSPEQCVWSTGLL